VADLIAVVFRTMEVNVELPASFTPVRISETRLTTSSSSSPAALPPATNSMTSSTASPRSAPA